MSDDLSPQLKQEGRFQVLCVVRVVASERKQTIFRQARCLSNPNRWALAGMTNFQMLSFEGPPR